VGDADTQPTGPDSAQLEAAREWLWRHSSQPNGDPWDSDPEHLEWAARNLLADLDRWRRQRTYQRR
jgi:hypothetical protein